MKLKLGYGALEDRQINFDNADMVLYREIVRQEPLFSACISCGSCTAGCPGGAWGSINFRKISHMIRMGIPLSEKDGIQDCMLCGKCIMTCPRGINTRKLILLIMDCNSTNNLLRKSKSEKKNPSRLGFFTRIMNKTL